MCQFACHFRTENAPGRSLSEVIAVVADGFFFLELVKKLDFVNAHIQDQGHLFDLGLVKIFGKSRYAWQKWSCQILTRNFNQPWILFSNTCTTRSQGMVNWS